MNELYLTTFFCSNIFYLTKLVFDGRTSKCAHAQRDVLVEKVMLMVSYVMSIHEQKSYVLRLSRLGNFCKTKH